MKKNILNFVKVNFFFLQKKQSRKWKDKPQNTQAKKCYKKKICKELLQLNNKQTIQLKKNGSKTVVYTKRQIKTWSTEMFFSSFFFHM